jgi:hypothetical protein
VPMEAPSGRGMFSNSIMRASKLVRDEQVVIATLVGSHAVRRYTVSPEGPPTKLGRPTFVPIYGWGESGEEGVDTWIERGLSSGTTRL